MNKSLELNNVLIVDRYDRYTGIQKVDPRVGHNMGHSIRSTSHQTF